MLQKKNGKFSCTLQFLFKSVRPNSYSSVCEKSQVTLPLLASQPDAIESHAVEF